MRFRIQTEDGRHVAWEQDGPVASPGENRAPLADVELWLTEGEAKELCLELAYQIMRARHPERPE